MNAELLVKESRGYTNSQSWEAWYDSVKVLWDNTDMIFLVSISLSLGAIAIAFFKFPNICDMLANFFEGQSEDKEKKQCSEKDKVKETNSYAKVCPLPLKLPADFRRKQGPSNICTAKPDERTNTSLFSNTKVYKTEIDSQMSPEELEKEREARNQQMIEIYRLMQEQQDSFGNTSIEEVRNQMKLYCASN